MLIVPFTISVTSEAHCTSYVPNSCQLKIDDFNNIMVFYHPHNRLERREILSWKTSRIHKGFWTRDFLIYRYADTKLLPLSYWTHVGAMAMESPSYGNSIFLHYTAYSSVVAKSVCMTKNQNVPT